MHNIKDLRKNLDNYKKKFNDRNLEFDITKFNKLDEINRNLILKKETLEQKKKSLSKLKNKSNFEKSKDISEEISSLTKQQNESQKNLNQILFSLPNVALNDVPVGKDEKSNKLIKKFGLVKDFSFKVKYHIEIGSIQNSIDFDTSIKLSGSRFVVLKDNFALLERALTLILFAFLFSSITSPVLPLSFPAIIFTCVPFFKIIIKAPPELKILFWLDLLILILL